MQTLDYITSYITFTLLHYILTTKNQEMQSNKKKLANVDTRKLLGYRVSSADWLNPFDERPMASCVHFIWFALYTSLYNKLYNVL